MQNVFYLTALGVSISLTVTATVNADYDVVSLGTLGAGESRALGVNSSAQVVGRSRIIVNQYSHWHAYRYDDGMLDLESLVGEDGESWGYGINEAGQVVGYSETTGWSRAFRWTDSNMNGELDAGEMIDLGTMGGFSSAARAVNTSGQVAGTAQIAGLLKYDHAFLWTDTNANNVADSGEMIDLGTLTGNNADPSHAWAMNDAGNVVGQADAGIQYHAFYWSDLNLNGTSETGEMIDLGTLGGTASHAYGVNNNDVVVGVATTAGSDARAFRWADANANQQADAGEMVGLGTLGGDDSAAYDINANGDIVGYAMTATSEVHAFLLENGGAMQDINDLIDPASGWVLEEAWGISDAGHIVGLGHHNGLSGQAFMLMPQITSIVGDLDEDGFVGITDLNIVLGAWNQTVPPGDSRADPNGDGFIGIEDLNIVLGNWNSGTPPSSNNIPEPGTLALLGLGTFSMIRRRRSASQ